MDIPDDFLKGPWSDHSRSNFHVQHAKLNGTTPPPPPFSWVWYPTAPTQGVPTQARSRIRRRCPRTLPRCFSVDHHGRRHPPHSGQTQFYATTSARAGPTCPAPLAPGARSAHHGKITLQCARMPVKYGSFIPSGALTYLPIMGKQASPRFGSTGAAARLLIKTPTLGPRSRLPPPFTWTTRCACPSHHLGGEQLPEHQRIEALPITLLEGGVCGLGSRAFRRGEKHPHRTVWAQAIPRGQPLGVRPFPVPGLARGQNPNERPLQAP